MIRTTSSTWPGANNAAQLELSDKRRFETKFTRRSVDECWPWTASVTHRGYGRFVLGGKVRVATQVAWEIANGEPFPAGMYACHRCDNPACVNPAHIYAGTPSENVFDSVRRGRHFHKKKTRCVNGHDLTDPDNLVRGRLPQRHCKKCKYQISRRGLLAKRAGRVSANV